jgi:hypothetical protein
MLKESDILFEIGDFWVCKAIGRNWQGYEVLKNGITHSVVMASIGYSGEKGLQRAIEEAKQRHNQLFFESRVTVVRNPIDG